MAELKRSAEVFVKESVSRLPHVGREVVLAVRVLHNDVLRHTVKAIDGGGGVQDCVHTLPAEVGVAQRCVDE